MTPEAKTPIGKTLESMAPETMTLEARAPRGRPRDAMVPEA